MQSAGGKTGQGIKALGCATSGPVGRVFTSSHRHTKLQLNHGAIDPEKHLKELLELRIERSSHTEIAFKLKEVRLSGWRCQLSAELCPSTMQPLGAAQPVPPPVLAWEGFTQYPPSRSAV